MSGKGRMEAMHAARLRQRYVHYDVLLTTRRELCADSESDTINIKRRKYSPSFSLD